MNTVIQLLYVCVVLVFICLPTCTSIHIHHHIKQQHQQQQQHLQQHELKHDLILDDPFIGCTSKGKPGRCLGKQACRSTLAEEDTDYLRCGFNNVCCQLKVVPLDINAPLPTEKPKEKSWIQRTFGSSATQGSPCVFTPSWPQKGPSIQGVCNLKTECNAKMGVVKQSCGFMSGLICCIDNVPLSEAKIVKTP